MSFTDQTEALDIRYQVETPEGIDLHAELAGPMPRILAYSIDIAIRLLLIALLSLLLIFAGDAGVGIILLLSFLLEWFYPVLYEVYRNGQTPGKKALGLQVVNDDLTPVNWNSALTRNLLRAADFLPLAYLGGLLCLVCSRRFQRLGDLAAGTLVIHRAADTDWQPQADIAPRVPAVALRRRDQLAIIAYSQRCQQLSTARRRELANLLSTISAHRDDAGVNYWREVASWLLGGRPQ